MRSGPRASAKRTGCSSAIRTPVSARLIIYSLIVSCQRHGKDPLAYLKDLLTRLPRMTNRDDLRLLLPRNWLPGAS